MLAEVWLRLIAALYAIGTAIAAEATAAAPQRLSCKWHAHEQRVQAGAQRPCIGSCPIVLGSLTHLVQPVQSRTVN
jgi:hypothetical protein